MPTVTTCHIASVYITLRGYAVALFESNKYYQDRTDDNKIFRLIDIQVSDRPSDKAIVSIIQKYLDDEGMEENPLLSHVLINRAGGTENAIWKIVGKKIYVIPETNPADLSIAINDEVLTFSDTLKARVLREVGSITDEAEIEHNHLVSSLLLGITDNNQVNKNPFCGPNAKFQSYKD